jgi:hypothetical protein
MQQLNDKHKIGCNKVLIYGAPLNRKLKGGRILLKVAGPAKMTTGYDRILHNINGQPMRAEPSVPDDRGKVCLAAAVVLLK